MKQITVKTVERKTSVTREQVRAAVKEAYAELAERKRKAQKAFRPS